MRWEYRVEALWARVGELADRMNDGGNAAGFNAGHRLAYMVGMIRIRTSLP